MTTLSVIVSFGFRLYMLLVFLRVLLSWIPISPYGSAFPHDLIRLLNRVTDPVLVPLRRIVPPIGGTMDITPIIALFLLEIVRGILVALLSGL